MSKELQSSFVVTNKGIYYKLLYCDALTRDIFDKSATEAVCEYCKANFPENNCEILKCRESKIEEHPEGKFSIFLRFLKPWYNKLTT